MEGMETAGGPSEKRALARFPPWKEIERGWCLTRLFGGWEELPSQDAATEISIFFFLIIAGRFTGLDLM